MQFRLLLVASLLTACASVQAQNPNTLSIGVASRVVTPFLDQPMAGYYYTRAADGVHDDLMAKALVLGNGQDRVVLVAIDAVEVPADIVQPARERIQKKLGIPADHIMISATHSHTGSQFTPLYKDLLIHWIEDTVVLAVNRSAPAHLSVAYDQEPTLQRNRRYLMKDGTVQTNPGFLNPNVVRPVGPVDPTVGVLYAEGACGAPIMTWVNYGLHLDTVGGTLISADFAAPLAKFLGRVKTPEMLTIFTIGPAGDINHWDVSKPGPQRGFDVAERIGNVLGASVVRAYTHMEPVAPAKISAISEALELPAATVTEQEVEDARKIDAKPPEQGVDFTIERVKAERDIRVYERHGKPYLAEIQVFAVGQVAFVAIPGELFNELGSRIRKESPFAYTFLVTLANDDIGYIPIRAGFAQGGYEPSSSGLQPGAGEAIADKAIELLKRISAQ